MPTYEYLCQTCSHRFETWQKMTDEPLTVCPECGSHIRRVLFASGVIFKGSGFYKTDHAKNGSLPAANGENHKAESTTGDAPKTGESKASETSASTPKPASGDNKATSAAAS